MNNICKDCPRYTPGYTYADGETWHTSHRCPGTACESYTGCVRRPWHPLAPVLNLVYNVDAEQWETEVKNNG